MIVLVLFPQLDSIRIGFRVEESRIGDLEVDLGRGNRCRCGCSINHVDAR